MSRMHGQLCVTHVSGFPLPSVLRTINSKYFQHLDLLRIRYKSLSLGLRYLNKGLADSQSLGLTILYLLHVLCLRCSATATTVASN